MALMEVDAYPGGPALDEPQDAVPLDPSRRAVVDFLTDFSIETSAGAAAKTSSFADHLPAGTRVYVAALPGQDFGDVVATVARLRREGLEPVPHVPARSLSGETELDQYIRALSEQAGITTVLCVGGGVSTPVGKFDRTMQVLETGVFDRYGVNHIGVAGHPEGSPDIPEAEVRRAVEEKNAYARRTGLDLFIATQFCFDAAAIIKWDKTLRLAGNTLPIHIGIAGPAKLKSLISYARMCGVGNSMRVLTRQAANLARLTAVSAPDRLVLDLATYQANDPQCGITRAHFFAFGGLTRNTRWLEGALAADFEMKRGGKGFTVNRDLD